MGGKRLIMDVKLVLRTSHLHVFDHFFLQEVICLKQSYIRSKDLVKLGTGCKTTREQVPDWTSAKQTHRSSFALSQNDRKYLHVIILILLVHTFLNLIPMSKQKVKNLKLSVVFFSKLIFFNYIQRGLKVIYKYLMREKKRTKARVIIFNSICRFSLSFCGARPKRANSKQKG